MPSTDGGYGKDVSLPFHESVIIATFIGIALYNVLELNIIVLHGFKRFRGLYFWSFMVAIWGIVPWSLGYLIKDFQLTSGTVLYSTFISVGWCAMVTGQSFVLYSRLHLVLQNDMYLRLVLAMIIVNAVVLHVPTIVMGFGANSNNPDLWLRLYPIYEKIEVTIFFVQELIISSLYVVFTARYFSIEGALLGQHIRAMMRRLILVNVLVIALDTTILVLEFTDRYDIQTAYKGMVYSIKLKLEFRILKDLVHIANSGQQSSVEYGRSSHCNTGGVQPTALTPKVGDRQVQPERNDGDAIQFCQVTHVNVQRAGGSGGSSDISPDRVGDTEMTDITFEEENANQMNEGIDLGNPRRPLRQSWPIVASRT